MYSSCFKVSSRFRCALKVVSTVSYISVYSPTILLYKVVVDPGFTMEMSWGSPIYLILFCRFGNQKRPFLLHASVTGECI